MSTNLINFGKKVKEQREKLGYSQQKLADIVGYSSRSTITKIEKGERDLPIDKLKILAKALETTPEYLLGWDTTKAPKSNMEILDNKIIGIPIFESISAGLGSIIDVSIMDNEEIEFLPMPLFPNWKKCFATKVSGDSMEPTIPNGSIVIIDTEFEIGNNKIGAFSIGEEAFLKRKKIISDRILLISDNKEYDPIIVTEFDNYKEIGKVIKVVSDFSKL